MRATFAEVSPQVTRITGIAPTDWIEVGQNTPSHISLSDALKELGISDRQLMKYRLIARKIKPYWDSALQRNPDYPIERKKQLEQKLKGGYVQVSYIDEPPFTWFEFLVLKYLVKQNKLFRNLKKLETFTKLNPQIFATEETLNNAIERLG
ncbi:MAG TPA: hypothetical protein V6D48_11440 [Oculatellaceae cyanobacterium]